MARKRPAVSPATQQALTAPDRERRSASDGLPPADEAATRSQPSRAQQVIELGALTMSSERNGPVHTLRLSGELDLATTARAQAELKRIEAGDAQTIVIDLTDLTFINSTGVHLLVDAEVRSRANAYGLTLLSGSPAVRRVLQICGVETALPFTD